jgi:hypothetical protein
MSELDAPTPPANLPDDEIKLVRLVTGEDIMCVIHDNLEDGVERKATDMVILSTPLKLVVHRSAPMNPDSPIAIGIMPWMPDELLEHHAVAVKVGHIVTVMEPKEELKRYYQNTVDAIHKRLIFGDQLIRLDIDKAASAVQNRPKANLASSANPSTMANVTHARLQELLTQLHDIDDYLMSTGNDDDDSNTFH